MPILGPEVVAPVADAVKVTGVPTAPDLLPIAASTGAWFTSLTVTLIVSESSRLPSETRTVIG